MATQYIERVDPTSTFSITDFLSRLNSQAHGAVVALVQNADDEAFYFYNRTVSAAERVGGVAGVMTPTVAFALTRADSGKTIFLNAAAGFAITLPALAAGLKFKFVTAAAFATTDFTIVTPGGVNVIQGGAIVNSTYVPAVNEDSINFICTAETIGDVIELECDGTNWLVNGVGAGAGAITFTVT